MSQGFAKDPNLHTHTSSGTDSALLGPRTSAGFAESTAIGADAATTKANQIKLGTADEITTLGGGMELGGYRTVEAAATLTVRDAAVFAAGSTNYTLTLPNNSGSGQMLYIKNIGTGYITVAPSSAPSVESLDGVGGATVVLAPQEFVVVIDHLWSPGGIQSNSWYILNRSQAGYMIGLHQAADSGTITAGTLHLCALNTVRLNPRGLPTSWYNLTAGNYRIIPQVKGMYLAVGQSYWTMTTAGYQQLQLRKNGSIVSYSRPNSATSTAQLVNTQRVLDMNGSTDYIDLQIDGISQSFVVKGGSTYTWLDVVYLGSY